MHNFTRKKITFNQGMSYFEVKLADQDKDLAPHIACNSNTKKRFWSLGKTRHVPFAIVMIWREAKIIRITITLVWRPWQDSNGRQKFQ